MFFREKSQLLFPIWCVPYLELIQNAIKSVIVCSQGCPASIFTGVFLIECKLMHHYFFSPFCQAKV